MESLLNHRMTLFLNMLVKRVAMRYYFVLQEIPTHRSVGKIDQFTNDVNCVQSSRYAKWAYVEIFIVAINWNRGKKLCFAQLFPSYAEKRDKRAILPNENEEKKNNRNIEPSCTRSHLLLYCGSNAWIKLRGKYDWKMPSHCIQCKYFERINLENH